MRSNILHIIDEDKLLQKDSDKPLKALFVISVYFFHLEVFQVIKTFIERGWHVEIVIPWVGPEVDEIIETYKDLGAYIHSFPPHLSYGYTEAATSKTKTESTISRQNTRTREVLNKRGPVEIDPARRHRFKSLWYLLKWIGVARLAARILDAFSLCPSMYQNRRQAHRIIQASTPDIVFFGEYQSYGRFENALFRTTKLQKKIRLCCYPGTSYLGKKYSIAARFYHLKTKMLSSEIQVDFDRTNRFLGTVLKNWTVTQGKQRIFRWDPVHMVVAWLFGLLSSDSWQKPDPMFDLVFVFSELSRTMLVESSYPADKICVVGMPRLDKVAAGLIDSTMQSEIYKILQLEPPEKFILFNVEPSAEHFYTDWDTHWKNFHTMMQLVTELGFPVVLSLHPLCKLETYIFAEEKYGVKISRIHSIYELYPYCFIAVSFPCSTNILAEIFDVPLVVHNFFAVLFIEELKTLGGGFVGDTVEEIKNCLCKALTHAVDKQKKMKINPISASETLETVARDLVIPARGSEIGSRHI